MTERLSNKCPCDKCGKGKKCELSQEACEDYLKWEDDCIKKLAEYEIAEEEGRLLILPCKPGDIVYVMIPSYTTCSQYGQVFEEYSCLRCNENKEECDSHLEYYIWENKYTTQQWIIGNLDRFGETIFINREEAELVLEEMNKDIGTN